MDDQFPGAAPPITLRPYRPSDLDGVRDVCFLTGFMGDPVAGQFADRSAFAHLFCDWYALHRAETCWVLVAPAGAGEAGAGEAGPGGAGVEGGERVVGYLLGSPDGPPTDGRHERALLTRHLLGRGLVVRPGTAGFFLRAARDLLADRSVMHPSFDTAPYPADLHIDLLPVARGRGLGRALMLTWFDRLRELGVGGVRLGTMGENHDAIAFFTAMGFEPLDEPSPNPGFRMPDGSRCTVANFGRRL